MKDKIFKTILKSIVCTVFGLSGLLKAYDLENTTEMFSSLLSIRYDDTRILLILLIALEFIIAGLCISQLHKKKVAVGISTVLVIFIMVNMLFLWGGNSNCGCLGTVIVSNPIISICKNVLLLMCIYQIHIDDYRALHCAEN